MIKTVRASFSGLDISLISDYTIQYIKYEIGPGEVFVWKIKLMNC